MNARALAALLWLAAPVLAQPPALDVEIAPPSATVGDLVTVTLTLRLPEADAALTPRFPDWSRGWGAAEVRSASPPERATTPDGAIWTQRVTLAAFVTGDVALPPVAVAIPRQPPIALATPADLALEIRSVLPADPASWQTQPPAPPVRLEVPAAFWWAAAALVVAAAAAWLAGRKTGTATLDDRRRTPWEELARALDAIDVRDAERAHTALSLALRRYLGRSFAMPAAQSSTRELGQRLATHGLAPELVRRAILLLREVDQVKFARVPATAERAASRRDEAGAVAAEVERHLHPPPAAEAAA